MISHYITLNPLIWHQDIRDYPGTIRDDEEGYLWVTCVADPRCELLLRNGDKLREYKLDLGIHSGELTKEERLKPKLESNAIGGLFFADEHSYFVHGWFYLRPKNYRLLWDQVRAATPNTDCKIRLGVGPVDADVWKSGPLSIFTASVGFSYRTPDQQPIAKRGFWRRFTSRSDS
jgi:hypothetical protein